MLLEGINLECSTSRVRFSAYSKATSAALYSLGSKRINSSRYTPALKQKIPEFHRKFPFFRKSLAVSSLGFSRKESTELPSCSIYPYPVSGLVGRIPKV